MCVCFVYVLCTEAEEERAENRGVNGFLFLFLFLFLCGGVLVQCWQNPTRPTQIARSS